MGSSKGGGGNDAVRHSGRVADTSDADLDPFALFDALEGDEDDAESDEDDEEAPTRVVLTEEMLLDHDEPSGTQGLEPSSPVPTAQQPAGPAPLAASARCLNPDNTPTRGGLPAPPASPGLPRISPAAGLPPLAGTAGLPPLAPPSGLVAATRNPGSGPPSNPDAEERTFVLEESSLGAFDDSAETFEVSRSGAKARGEAPPRGKSKSVEGEELHVGRNFGGFRVVRGIAAGGMASVFLGRKEALGGFTQHAAIKIVHARFAAEKDFIDMFLDEARIAARIQHPNVCRVLDFGTAEGTYFLALEYVHGETWTSVLRALMRSEWGRARMQACAAYVVAQACEGMHAAHTTTDEHGQPLNIVHRDISPDNLLVGYDGTVRVLDFGVAHAEARLTNTRAGVVKGRLAYMAPEQARGESIDHRADVWSLGVVLRESLEGKRLFRRESEAQTILAVTHDPLPPWEPEVEEGLRAIADKALRRDPDERYATARELGLALTNYLRVNAKPVSMAEVSVQLEEVFPERRSEKLRWMTQSIPKAVVEPSDAQTVAPPARPPGTAARAATMRMDAVGGQSATIDRNGWLALGAACLAALIVAGLWISRWASRPPVRRPVPVLITPSAPGPEPLPPWAAEPPAQNP